MGENSDDEETSAGLYYRMIPHVEQDNKNEFVRLINRLESRDKKSIIMEICHYDAANCLAAILDREAGDESLINYYLTDLAENNPLHYAAREAKPRITSLLLDKGFSPNLRTDYNSPHICLNNALPLNVSLDYARYTLWDYDRFISPIHQIIHLCKWLYHIKTIRVLARNTKEIKHEFLKYLKQGKVFEVGALLAIASDLIMSSSSTIDGENGSSSIGFKNIMEMRQFLLAEMSRSMGASDTQLKEIKKTLRLLEIFDRVGDKLLPHMPKWDDYTSEDPGVRVASLIKDAAYDEEEEVEYDHDAVPREYYNPLPFHHTISEPSTYSIVTNPCVYSVLKSTSSTKVHFPSCLEELSCRVDTPRPLPTQGLMWSSLAVKVAMTKHVLSNKLATFTGAFAKAIRHLRYR